MTHNPFSLLKQIPQIPQNLLLARVEQFKTEIMICSFVVGEGARIRVCSSGGTINVLKLEALI
jgi:hypothetical protein